MLNVTLNPAYVVPNAAEFEKSFKACVQLEAGTEELKDGLWSDIVARICVDGVQSDVGIMLGRLTEFEAIAQTVGGPDGPVERKRAPRKGVADTGFVTPDTFKTYKSIIKRALTADVELLDEEGVPRTSGAILKDLEDTKVEKPASEKLTNATNTWLAIADKLTMPDDAEVLKSLAQMIADKAAALLS